MLFEAIQECSDKAREIAADSASIGRTAFWPEDDDWPENEELTLPSFTLWLEFEHWQIAEDESSNMGWHVTRTLNSEGEITKPGGWADETFFNMSIKLSSGKEYCLNVWTHKYLSRSLCEGRARGEGLGGKYTLAPDLFVERADRGLLEEVVTDLIRRHALKEDWLCDKGELEESS